MSTPYAQYVGDRDPVLVLDESLKAYQVACARLTARQWDQPWQEGKWTVREILVHVSQWEMIFGTRLRLGLGVAGYSVQPVNQDDLMREATAVDGPTAFAAFEAVRRMNLAFARSLTGLERARHLHHEERGEIDVTDVLITLAGHPVHHLRQIESVLASGS